MIRLARLTDYAFVLLAQMARAGAGPTVLAASDLADLTHLPQPTVSKVLKTLNKAGLLTAHRGARGGYTLSAPPDSILALDIIRAMEGPVAITDCLDAGRDKPCELEGNCPTSGHWTAINVAMMAALNAVTLADMALPQSEFLLSDSGTRLATLRDAVRPATPCQTGNEGTCACHQAAQTVRNFSKTSTTMTGA
jgi:FeS assembly SUF system regulator